MSPPAAAYGSVPKIGSRNSQSSEGPAVKHDLVALSDSLTWRGPVAKSSSAHLSRVMDDVPPRESTTPGSNVCEWVASLNAASSREYGSDLDDAITMSLSECSSGGGVDNGGGTGGGFARRDARGPFDENFALPRKMAPRSGSGRVKSAEALPYHPGGITTQSSTWAPFSDVCIKGTAFLDQHEAATLMAQQPVRSRPSETSSTSTHSKPGQGHRPSLRTPRLSHFFPDDGNSSSSSSSSDVVLKRGQAGILDDIANISAQKRQSEGRRGSVDNCDMHPGRQSPRDLLAKVPCAVIGILRARDERRRRQRRQRQREQQRLRQAGPGLGRSDSDQEYIRGYWTKNARSICRSESSEMSPSSSPTLLSPLKRKVHGFETLRSPRLSAEASTTANDDRPLGQENNGFKGSARGTTRRYFAPATKSSTGEPPRHRGLTHGQSVERLSEDDAQRADASAPEELMRSPVENIVPENDSPISTVVGSRWGVRLMVATDHRAGTVAAAGAERRPLVECSYLSPVGVDNLDSVIGFGSTGLRLRAGVDEVARVPAVVDPIAAITVGDIPHGSLVTVAAAPSPPRRLPPTTFHRSENSVSLSCSRPSSFQRLPQPRANGADVAVAAAVAETSTELAPPRHVGGGGSGGGGGCSGGGNYGTGGGGGFGGGIEKRERKPKGRKTRLLDSGNGRGFRFGYGYDHDYDDFRAMWSPEGGAGGGRKGEGGRGERGRGERGAGADASGSRYSHRGCCKVGRPGYPKNIWPSSPSSSSQHHRAQPECTFPPPPPGLLRLSERRLRAGSRVRAGKGLSGTSSTSLEVVDEAGTSDFVGARGRRKEDERCFGRVCTNSSSRSNSRSSRSRNNSSKNNVYRADKCEEFMLTE